MKSNLATVTVTVGSPPPTPPVAVIRAPSAVVFGSRFKSTHSTRTTRLAGHCPTDGT